MKENREINPPFEGRPQIILSQSPFYRNLFIGLAPIVITTYYSKCSEPLEKEVIA